MDRNQIPDAIARIKEIRAEEDPLCKRINDLNKERTDLALQVVYAMHLPKDMPGLFGTMFDLVAVHGQDPTKCNITIGERVYCGGT